jgi:hypothetical protein
VTKIINLWTGKATGLLFTIGVLTLTVLNDKLINIKMNRIVIAIIFMWWRNALEVLPKKVKDKNQSEIEKMSIQDLD